MTPAHLSQLASDWKGALPAWAIGEVKHDGWRGLYLRDRSGKPGLFTRQGQTIHGAEHILHELAAWERHAGERLFIDGEFIVDGPDTLAATKHWCETGHKLGGTAGTFNVFDGFSYDDWFRGGTDKPWFDRKAAIEALALAVESDADHAWTWRPGARGDEPCPVRVVPHVDLFHVDDALQFVAEFWRAGLEGAVFKDAEAGYWRTRSNSWMKCGRPWQDKIRWREAA